jgi:hypothetical protein
VRADASEPSIDLARIFFLKAGEQWILAMCCPSFFAARSGWAGASALGTHRGSSRAARGF